MVAVGFIPRLKKQELFIRHVRDEVKSCLSFPAQLLFNAKQPVEVPPGWPVRLRGPSGLYLLNVLVQPPLAKGATTILNAEPPGCTHHVEVT
jgi:hypothetical protein